jgi:HEAT repeat protein
MKRKDFDNLVESIKQAGSIRRREAQPSRITEVSAERMLEGKKLMALPTVEELVAALDQKRQSDLGEAEGRLFKEHGLEALVPGFIAAFPKIKNSAGRNSILFWIARFTRKRPEIVDLALLALRDPAYMVRMQACGILAYSLRKDCIPHLEELLKHKNQKTRDDAAAAIDAIKHQNHHYWIDSDHTGKAFWTVNPEDNR